jgi:raffinose/stachyose/melibiose transport system permease protein
VTTTSTQTDVVRGTSTKRWRFPGYVAVFLGPALIVYTMFMVYPLLDSLRLSLFSDEGAFVGLSNFRELLPGGSLSSSFWNALGNNFVFFAFHLLVQNPVGLFLAVLLTQHLLKRGKGTYRTLIFSPTVLSVVIVGFIWQLILSPLWGLVSKPLLGLTSTALPTLSLMSVWQFVGIPMMFFYAVLVGIPQDLVEAARVDGASGWKIFWKIIFPLLLPMLGIISIITYIANLNAFDLIYSVQGALAGPEFSTDIMGTLFYRSFFGFQLQPGSTAMGATVATAMFIVILLGVLVYLFGWAKRVETYEL